MTRRRIVGWVGVLATAGLSAGGCGGGELPAPTDAGQDAPAVDAAQMDVGTDAFVPPVDAGPLCMGMPPDCASATNASDCTAIQGCAFGACAGTPMDCHRVLDMATCGAIQGCSWSSGLCRGTATPCGAATDMTMCMAQMGCAWGATSSCSGTPTRCDLLSAAACTTQPGCGLGPHDAGPPDAFVPPPDAGCTTGGGGGSTMITIHTVEPDPVAGGTRDLGMVHVHAESACGGMDMQLLTDATGHLTLDLPDGGAPWAITMALAGYAAVSVIDVTQLGFDGDVRLDPFAMPAMGTHVASGTVTGAAAGSSVQVDCYDFDTTMAPAPGRAFSSNFYFGAETPEAPLQFVALETDAMGTLLNIGSTSPIARPHADATGITIAMASPALTPVTSHVLVHLPATGLGAGGAVTAIGAEHARLDLPSSPYVLTGTNVIRNVGGADYDLAVTHFPGALDVNLTGLGSTASGTQLNVIVTDITDHTITVPSLTDLSFGGSSFADLSVSSAGAGYEVLGLHIGESMTERPRWRVYAETSTGTRAILALPHLPSAVTLADIGLGAPTTTVIPLAIHMQSGRAWTTEALNHAVWQYAYAIGTSYTTVSTAGR